MNYQRLFCLTIFHDYYQDQTCPDFTIEPTQACRKLLQGHRLLVKPMVNGLWVMVPLDDFQQPVIPLAESLVFTFLLKLKSQAFVSFTQLATDYDAVQSLYAFSNQNLETPGVSELSPILVQRFVLSQPAANQSALEQRWAHVSDLKIAGRDKVFGLVEIHRNGSLVTAPLQTSEFKIRFAVKQQIWKYYLIAANAAQSATFSIQDKDANIAFMKADIDPSDRVLALIQHRFPSSQPVLFQSEAPVPCQEMGRQNIQLLKNGQTQPWIPHLPNPPNQHGSQVVNVLEDV